MVAAGTNPPGKLPNRERRPGRGSRGSTLIIVVAAIIMLLGFMGVAIYTGLQAFLHNELQKSASAAAMVASSAYYTIDENGNPVALPSLAEDVARSTFTGSAQASSLNGFSPTINDVSVQGGKVTVDVAGSLGTPLLAPLGMDKVQMNSKAVTVPLKYEPLPENQSLVISPRSNDVGSYNRLLKLKFPIVDKPGRDFYIEEDPMNQQGYVVEACTDDECYDLGAGATPVGTARIEQDGGAYIIYGSAVFDLTPLKITKASQLRITHGNNFAYYYQNGVQTGFLPGVEKPLEIRRISIYGYSGACPEDGNCAVPFGFSAI